MNNTIKSVALAITGITGASAGTAAAATLDVDGGAFDRLDEATVAPDLVDHGGVSADVFMNLPVGGGALTAELDYARVEQNIAVPGTDRPAAGSKSHFTGDYALANLGYLFAARTVAGRLQPYVRYEKFSADADNVDENSAELPDAAFAVDLNQ